MKEKAKVFISTSSFAEHDRSPLTALENNGIAYTLNSRKRKLSGEEIRSCLEKSAYSGLIAGTEPLNGVFLPNPGSLKVISRVGAGMDNIDLIWAREHKIKVYNTPGVLTDAVAELTIGLIISCLRRVGSMDRMIRQGRWKKEMGSLFKGKTLGIIGCGRIGKRVACLAGAFGCKVIAYDPEKITSRNIRQVTLESLLSGSDIITIHASVNKPVISGKHVSRMIRKPVLINTSRGAAISEDVLYKALSAGKITFAALDVFESEPYKGKLRELNNVILTPHIGSYAREARIAMEKEAVDNLIRGLKIRDDV